MQKQKQYAEYAEGSNEQAAASLPTISPLAFQQNYRHVSSCCSPYDTFFRLQLSDLVESKKEHPVINSLSTDHRVALVFLPLFAHPHERMSLYLVNSSSNMIPPSQPIKRVAKTIFQIQADPLQSEQLKVTRSSSTVNCSDMQCEGERDGEGIMPREGDNAWDR